MHLMGLAHIKINCKFANNNQAKNNKKTQISLGFVGLTTWALLGYSQFCDKSNCHNWSARSYPNYRHIMCGQNFVMFSVLRGTRLVSHGIDFVMFFGLGSDKNQVSQISDTATMVTKFITKKICFHHSIHFMTHIRRQMYFRHLSVTKCKT